MKTDVKQEKHNDYEGEDNKNIKTSKKRSIRETKLRNVKNFLKVDKKAFGSNNLVA